MSKRIYYRDALGRPRWQPDITMLEWLDRLIQSARACGAMFQDCIDGPVFLTAPNPAALIETAAHKIRSGRMGGEDDCYNFHLYQAIRNREDYMVRDSFVYYFSV